MKMKNELWIDKYKPKIIDELIVDDIIKMKLKNMVNNLQNIIMSGYVGIGKTISIQCLLNEIYGIEIKNYVLELNSPDDRGVKSMGEIIQNFCKKKVLNPVLKKVIIIDDADNIPVKVQQIINSLMEQYKTIFMFSCNEPSYIIESIQNKCIILNYPKLTDEMIIKKLIDICNKEGKTYTLNGLKLLCNGDMRNAINNLQIIGLINEEINEVNVCNICNMPQIVSLKKIIELCLKDNFDQVSKYVIDMCNAGYLYDDIINGLMFLIKSNEDIKMNEDMKIKYFQILSETILIFSNGISNDIQLLACMAKLCDIKKINQ